MGTVFSGVVVLMVLLSFVALGVEATEIPPQAPVVSTADDAAAAREVGSVIVNVPGIGNVGVMTRKNWEVQVREGAPASSVRMNAWQLSIQLTFIPRSTSGDEDAQKNSVRKMAEQYVAGSVERAVQLRRLPTGLGSAILANFNQRSYQNVEVPPGEYSSITVGQIDHEQMTVAVTILTNGPDTQQHDDALLVVESLLLL